MRLGLAQMNIETLNLSRNRQTAQGFFQQAREKQVDLLLFPEMTLTGFARNVQEMLAFEKEIFTAFQEWTSQYQVAALFGYACALTPQERAERPQARPAYNRLCLMENGQVHMTYDKIHPFSRGFEGGNYEPGRSLGTTRFHGWELGAFQCYDLRFPAFFSLLGETCQLIVVPANWPDFRIDAWDTLLCARALENQCFVAGINRVGRDEKSAYPGHSTVFDPKGGRLIPVSEKEELLVVQLDQELIEKSRAKMPQLKDRKGSLLFQLFQESREKNK